MARSGHILTSPQTQSISGAVLSTLWLLFPIAHLSTFGVPGKTNLLVFAIAETVVAVFFLLRTPIDDGQEDVDRMDRDNIADHHSAASTSGIPGTYSRH